MKKVLKKFRVFRFFDPSGLAFFLKKENLSNMVLIFMFILFLPLIDDVFHFSSKIESYQLKENRSKISRPKLNINSIFPYLNKYQKYYKDNFNFRNSLIYWSNVINMTLFNEPLSDGVLIGKDKWLFLAKESGYDMINGYLNTKPFSQKELELWQKRLNERQKWASRHGCIYIFVIPPSKPTVYREKMPHYLKKYHSQSRLDQLVDYIRADNELNLIDLRPLFLKLKSQRRVYRRTDTHWNGLGAFAAYGKIMDCIKLTYPEARPASLKDFRISREKEHGGDLATMLSLETSLFTDEIIYLRSVKKRKARKSSQRFIAEGIQLLEFANPIGKLPPMLFVHDSFGLFLHPFLAEHFKKTYCIQDKDLTFYRHFVKEKKIKIIVEEMAERFLLYKQLPPIE